jgi:RimJ/RimL family protein N-acetyltransferase
MNEASLSVREIRQQDIECIADYWLLSSPQYLQSLGVDLSKMPTREQWREMLAAQINQPYEQKKSYCIIWEMDGKPIGHSNINKIICGEEAYMHLHIWQADSRMKGHGSSFIQLTLPWFFEKYNLKRLYCEPYACNPAPNKALAKAGFEFVKEYVTIPGWINFEQPVKLWVIKRENVGFKRLPII